MAQEDPQDGWGDASPLRSLTGEAYDPGTLSISLESEDEAPGKAGDQGATGDPGQQARPGGSSHVTEDNPDLLWQHPACRKEEKFSDSFSAAGVGKKPMALPEKKTSWEKEASKITPTQASPGASMTPSALPRGLSRRWFGETQSPRASLSAGDEGDSRANPDVTPGIPSDSPYSARYFRAQKDRDKSPASSSPGVRVPKSGGSWDLSTQETHTPTQESATQARLAAEEDLAKGRKGSKDPNPGTSGEGRQGEARPYKCLRGGRAVQKSPGAKPYACELCGKAYSHRATLQQHQCLHTGERPYRCPFCDKTYTWSSDHRKHIRTHTGEKPYPCPDCGKAFVRSSDLRKHQRNMHSNDKPFPCAECGLTFNKPLSLLRHQRTHLGEKPFRCPTCDREFAVASRMMEHQRVHSGERPFPCPTCGKCFTKSSNLLEHQTLHSGQRPFKCADCGVAFAQPSRLARHQRIHTGERPFPCAQCGQAFARSSTLKRHQQIHSGEKGFLCAECGRAFRVASELAQHIRVHNGERPYQCADCGQAFTRSNHLRRHRARHHSCKKEPTTPSSDDE
ncbi:hypothetical protein FD754_018561 [Muntiacus muntjak]|uniref:C2H2-type domain-containing protein n=1 Tax=Muntiacus muntjak TaxID=9888 RepID=A0A5N3UXV5_MUNMU|nr:hypothetical protein FD754_018561 [Muntiacus muntjak]